MERLLQGSGDRAVGAPGRNSSVGDSGRVYAGDESLVLFSGSCSGPFCPAQGCSIPGMLQSLRSGLKEEQKPSSLAGTKDSRCPMDLPLSPEINLP